MRQSSIHMLIRSAKGSSWGNFTGEFVMYVSKSNTFVVNFRYAQFSGLRHHVLNGKNY